MNRPWGHSNKIGSLYWAEKSRFGCGETKIKHGDLVMCVRHSGDHFYDYVKVEAGGGDLWLDQISEVGSYSFNELARTLTDREYHLLAAGESIPAPRLIGRSK